jgi:hypothetical protein
MLALCEWAGISSLVLHRNDTRSSFRKNNYGQSLELVLSGLIKALQEDSGLVLGVFSGILTKEGQACLIFGHPS